MKNLDVLDILAISASDIEEARYGMGIVNAGPESHLQGFIRSTITCANKSDLAIVERMNSQFDKYIEENRMVFLIIGGIIGASAASCYFINKIKRDRKGANDETSKSDE